LATSVTVARQSCETSSTLALSTLVSFLRRFCGELEGDAGHADDFVFGVAHGVPGFAGGLVPLARLAEVEAAEQFANEENVGAVDDLGRSGLLTASSLKAKAGRRLAKPPSAARICSRPASGRLSGGRELNSLPPTAPSRTASDRARLSSVSAGSGVPSL
jgi:hypothetical protein